MTDILCKLINIGSEVGTVTSAMMYDFGYMTIDGITTDSKKFSITLNIKEEKEDGN